MISVSTFLSGDSFTQSNLVMATADRATKNLSAQGLYKVTESDVTSSGAYR
jgi:hypothetical protein